MSDSVLSYFANERLGKNRSLTPEGFLLVSDCPLARTGVQLYSENEGIQIPSDANGIIRVNRDANEVFHPIAISSFNGKPITNDHPPEKVSPENWKMYSIGTVLNPRRGDGREFDDDFLYADLLIHDKDAIKDILDGKVQISCGYDAEYESIRPGEGRQHFIVGNHVALVEKGRCGPRCAIGDKIMTTKNQPAWADALQQAYKTQNDAEFVQTLQKLEQMMGEVWLGKPHTNAGYAKVPSAAKDEDMEGGGTHVHIHQGESKGAAEGDTDLAKRIDALERAVAIMAQAGGEKKKESKDRMRTRDEKEDEDDDDKDDKKKDKSEETEDSEKEDDEDDKKDKEESKDRKATKDRQTVTDSASLRAVWQETLSRAEFLAPGIKLPTFDAKQPATLTQDSMCKFRRKVLDEALKEDETKAAIIEVNGGSVPKLTTMSCDHVASIYVGASNTMRQLNSKIKSNDTFNMSLNGDNSPSAMVADINKSNKSFWSNTAIRRS